MTCQTFLGCLSLSTAEQLRVLTVSLQNKHGDTVGHLIDPSTSNRLVLDVPLRTSDNPHFVTIAADSEICKERISTKKGGAGSTVFKKVEVNAIYAGFSIKDNLIFAGSNEVGAVKLGSPPFAIECPAPYLVGHSDGILWN